jgi:hypothetical protein
MSEDRLGTNTKEVSRLVFDVYDEYKTARLNVYYYEKRHNSFRIWNFWIELFVAISVPSVAGLWIWNTDVGNIIWKIIAVISAILAVVKPLIGLSNQMQENLETLTQWRLLHGEFQKLVISISQYGVYSEKMRDQFLKLLENKTNIKEPPDNPNDTLKAKCQKVVNEELKVDRFFIPENEKDVIK